MKLVWRLGKMLNHAPPTISLLRVRDGEEDCKNKTLPLFNILFRVGNMLLYWNKVGSNFQFMLTLTKHILLV